MAKTPPVRDGAADEAAEAAEVAGEAAGADPEPEGPAVAEAPATADPQAEPVGVARALDVAKPSCSTEFPGSGKRTSFESWVVQPLLTFATNMLGRAL